MQVIKDVTLNQDEASAFQRGSATIVKEIPISTKRAKFYGHLPSLFLQLCKMLKSRLSGRMISSSS